MTAPATVMKSVRNAGRRDTGELDGGTNGTLRREVKYTRPLWSTRRVCVSVCCSEANPPAVVVYPEVAGDRVRLPVKRETWSGQAVWCRSFTGASDVPLEELLLQDAAIA